MLANALSAALHLYASHWIAILVSMMCVQGVLIWLVIPVLNTLMRGALTASGVDGLNQTSILELLSSPFAVLALLGFALVATAFVLLELVVFAVIGHLALDGEPVAFRSVLRRLGTTARKAWSWQGLILAAYLLLLLPLSHVGVSSVLTSHIAIPKFVSGELMKTITGAILYWLVIALIAYAALRFSLALATLTGDGKSVLSSLGRSFRDTWRLQGPIAIAFLAVGVVASAVLLVVALLGAGVVALSPQHTTAGIALGILETVRFLVTGFGAALLAFLLVALSRAQHDGTPVTVPRAGHRPGASGATRGVAIAVIVAAALVAVPRIASTTDAYTGATSPADTTVIGHRGYPERAVENSLEGLKAAASAGADMIELDIQETADGGFVVMHDASLQRLAGDPRAIYDLTTEEANQVTIRQGAFTSTIPTLQEFVATADRLSVRLLVEVKPHGHEAPGFAEHVVEVMNALDPAHKHMIQSLDLGLITNIARLDPKRGTAYVVGLQLGDLPRAAVNAIVIEDWSYDDSMLSVAHANDQQVFVWTVNDPGLIRDYLGRGVDGIITDNVTTSVVLRETAAEVTNPVSRYLERAIRLVGVS